MEFNLKEIKKISQEFFSKLGILEDFEIKELQEKIVSLKLEVSDPRILIGQKGQTLLEIQRLLQIILRKKIGQDFFLDLDINNYKEKKKKYLQEIARTIADEVALTKKSKELPPMSAYERKIIHLELAQREDVTTESIGKEPERRVVIRPYP